MLHYLAKEFFADIIVTGHINSARQLQLYTVNDKFSPVENVNVIVRVYKYDSPDFTPIYENHLALNLVSSKKVSIAFVCCTITFQNASASQLIQTIQTDEFLAERHCDKYNCFFHFVVQKNASLTDAVAISPENYVFPAKLKESVLVSPTLQVRTLIR